MWLRSVAEKKVRTNKQVVYSAAVEAHEKCSSGGVWLKESEAGLCVVRGANERSGGEGSPPTTGVLPVPHVPTFFQYDSL